MAARSLPQRAQLVSSRAGQRTSPGPPTPLTARSPSHTLALAQCHDATGGVEPEAHLSSCPDGVVQRDILDWVAGWGMMGAAWMEMQAAGRAPCTVLRRALRGRALYPPSPTMHSRWGRCTDGLSWWCSRSGAAPPWRAWQRRTHPRPGDMSKRCGTWSEGFWWRLASLGQGMSTRTVMVLQAG